MTTRAKPLQVMDSGRVVSVPPAMLSVKDAAIYCACSASLLNSLRSKDATALRMGGTMTGPVWIKVGFGIRYKPQDLDAWLERTAVSCGVMESRRRLPAPTADEMAEAAQP